MQVEEADDHMRMSDPPAIDEGDSHAESEQFTHQHDDAELDD